MKIKQMQKNDNIETNLLLHKILRRIHVETKQLRHDMLNRMNFEN